MEPCEGGLKDSTEIGLFFRSMDHVQHVSELSNRPECALHGLGRVGSGLQLITPPFLCSQYIFPSICSPMVWDLSPSFLIIPPDILCLGTSPRGACLYILVLLPCMFSEFYTQFQTGSDFHDNDSWCEDESLFDSLNNKPVKVSDLDREWQRRHAQFHTIGYRDGLTAGKEASVQEGFNVGFKQSVLVGYNWGLVRGITSALACLPDDLKGNLVETLENREKLQSLYESVKSLSSRDALNIFHNDIVARSSKEHDMHFGGNFSSADVPNEILCNSQLGRHHRRELESFLLECPAIKVHWDCR